MSDIKLTKEEQRIVEDNHNLIYSFIYNKGLNLEEWYGLLAIELCQAVKFWDSKLSKLSTYYYIRANSAMLKEYRDRGLQKRKANEYTTKYEIGHHIDTDNSIENDIYEKLYLEELLKYGHEDIVRARYEGYTQEEIAKQQNMSQANVSRILTEVLEKYKSDNRGDVDNKYDK